MAILDRFNWSKTGFMTVREIIQEALSRSGIRYGSIKEYISTKLSEYSTESLLDAISVNLSNFFDEDAEAMTMREVLDETLRPFGMRLIQKGGQIILYDLNHIHTSLTPEAISWCLNDSTLGVDKVFNNVKLTFSPYEKTELLNGSIDPKTVGTGQKLTTRGIHGVQ